MSSSSVITANVRLVFNAQVPMSELNECTAVMQVFDFNKFTKHCIIGEIRLQLNTVDWNHVIEEWKDLMEASKFDVRNFIFSSKEYPAF